jgi:hypothetical protein
VTVLVRQCLGVSGQPFRFLKTFPKHLLLLYLFGRAARETIKVRRLIWREGLWKLRTHMQLPGEN